MDILQKHRSLALIARQLDNIDTILYRSFLANNKKTIYNNINNIRIRKPLIISYQILKKYVNENR